MTDLSGAEAHAAGHPISACPFAPGDHSDEAHAWRADWIRAEAGARHAAGTFGASDDEYRAAGLVPPSSPPHVWPTQVQIDAIIAATNAAAQVIQDSLAALTSALHDSLASFVALLDDVEADASPHRPCPTHGPTRSGLCYRCEVTRCRPVPEPRTVSSSRSATARSAPRPRAPRRSSS